MLSCVDTAPEPWVAADGGADTADLYDRAVAAVRA